MISYDFQLKNFHNDIIIRYIPLFCASFHTCNTSNMNSEERLASVGRNIQEKAAVIWNVANSLYGAYKPHEYGLVILPMTLIKRFHDCLLEKHDDVLATYEKVKELAVKDGFLKAASGYNFFNTSKFTFETLRADAENIEDNFRAYINGFSENVQDSARWVSTTRSNAWRTRGSSIR